MSQDEIFKLLLILLLMGNEREDCNNGCDGRFSSFNEIIIISLLMGMPCGCGDRERNFN